jgi:hypothetical protein
MYKEEKIFRGIGGFTVDYLIVKPQKEWWVFQPVAFLNINIGLIWKASCLDWDSN